jgi:glycosyltransferase involved in cell wall biosynthesis
MTDPVATVIIPTFNHGLTLELAVRSALAQSVPVEVYIVGDGVPDANKPAIRDLVAGDPRVTFFDHPKHESRGEPYRHAAIAAARGRIICYLCDRDIWLPDHVAGIDEMLRDADFCHSLPLHIFPGEDLRFYALDLQIPIHRYTMVNLWNRIPLSCAAHRRDFYHELEDGWSSTPQGELTDWHFFKKFVRRRDCRAVSGVTPTALTFPTGPRPGWTDDRRLAEMEVWHGRIASEASRQALTVDFLKKALKQRDKLLGDAYLKLFKLRQEAAKAATVVS